MAGWSLYQVPVLLLYWASLMSKDSLMLTWRTLTGLLELYKPESREWSVLCESRRLVEVELRLSGVTAEEVVQLHD